MQIIGQGLRRSGTSIFYRLISEDPRFVTFSEPLAKDRKSIGETGSGVKQIDHMKHLRIARNEFLNSSEFENLEFNHGAPTDYTLETTKNSIPNSISDYIKYLLNYGENTFMKFVRCTFNIEQLSKISNEALFIHLEKNPALWAMSHMYGRKYNEINNNADWFFTKDDKFNYWSQETIANHYIMENKPEYIDKPAYFKLLYIWKVFNDRMKNDGKHFFDKRFMSIENTNLYSDYSNIVEEIYGHSDLEVPLSTIEWAEKVLKPPREIVFYNDYRWEDAFGELKIDKQYLHI